MDVHKPKPWHGVREFLKEYLIIVVGVLTALAAEAVVERLHEERLSREALTAVRDEINVDITLWASRFTPQRQACLVQRLEEITALLDKAEAGRPFQPAAAIFPPNQPGLFTQRWTIATAGGRTSLLSSEQQRAFGRVYEPLTRLRDAEDEEMKVWLSLRALRGQRHISRELIHDGRVAVSAAADWNTIIGNRFKTAKKYAAQLGIKGDDGFAKSTVSSSDSPGICRPIYGPAAPAERP